MSTGFVGFFCSSRRRQTSCLSDWSSDVCSSDLPVRTRTTAHRTFDLTGGQARLCYGEDRYHHEQRAHWLIYWPLRDRNGRQQRSEERRVGKEWRAAGWRTIDKIKKCK